MDVGVRRCNNRASCDRNCIRIVSALIILVIKSIGGRAADSSLNRYVFAVFQSGLHVNDNAEGKSTDGRSEGDYQQTIPTFLTLYIFGFLYELLLVWDALRLKNTIQVIGLCIYNLGLLVYAAVQMDQIDEAQTFLRFRKGNDGGDTAIDLDVWSGIKPFLIAIPCVIAIGTIAMSFVARKLYDEFAWTIYKHISADLRMKRRYLTYQVSIHICISGRKLTRCRFILLCSSSISSSSSALRYSL